MNSILKLMKGDNTNAMNVQPIFVGIGVIKTTQTQFAYSYYNYEDAWADPNLYLRGVLLKKT